jgi:hypothetical protein
MSTAPTITHMSPSGMWTPTTIARKSGSDDGISIPARVVDPSVTRDLSLW